MGEEKKSKHDAEEVKEILSVVSEKVPELLTQLSDVLYGAEQSKKYGQAVAQFYKELKDAGMSDKEAFELTKQYMSIFSMGGALGKMMGGSGLGHHGHDDIGEEIQDHVEKAIKIKLEKKFKEDEDED
ncbi:MAG: hypothetical protein KAI64_01270 [Thermoplasmata archaeon]|nr:hypothetical protein [Thermoplasmata archaeon]